MEKCMELQIQQWCPKTVLFTSNNAVNVPGILLALSSQNTGNMVVVKGRQMLPA